MKKIAFVGCGKIASFHAEVLVSLGAELKAVTVKSQTPDVDKFINSYKISKVYYDVLEMMSSEDLDAIWILVTWNEVESILEKLIPFGIPIFVEKPVALTSVRIKELIQLRDKFNTKIQIGYNRRFYDFVPELRKRLNSSDLRAIQVEIPESTRNMTEFQKEYLWIHNSSHVIDLLIHLVGDLNVLKVLKAAFNDDVSNTFNAFLSTSNGIPVHLSANWNSPANFGIKIYYDDVALELKPIEALSTYHGFDIIEPTLESPLRRYLPRVVEQLYCSDINNPFKPGFLKQTQYFLGIGQVKEFIPANLEDALTATLLIESILTNE